MFWKKKSKTGNPTIAAELEKIKAGLPALFAIDDTLWSKLNPPPIATLMGYPVIEARTKVSYRPMRIPFRLHELHEYEGEK